MLFILGSHVRGQRCSPNSGFLRDSLDGEVVERLCAWCTNPWAVGAARAEESSEARRPGSCGFEDCLS